MAIQTRIIFNDGINSYTFPYVYKVSDPKEGIKATVIDGNRGDGTIVIPGNKKSQNINIEGRFFGIDYTYENIVADINDIKDKVSTNEATLTLQHYDGSSWTDDWQYTVRRLGEIEFPQSLRTSEQKYKVTFKVLSY